MIGLAVLAWTMQTPDLLHRVVPRPTGQNGYEEYLQAADLLGDREASIFANWAPGVQSQEKNPSDPDGPRPSRSITDLYAKLNALPPLEVRREELLRFGKVLDLVARGNAKRVYDPRSNMGPDTLFPELSPFRQVARFAVRAASVYASDGETGRAADTLLDALAFADNTARGVLISNLVGAANTAVVLGGFVDLLPRLSRPDALRVQHAADSLLTRPLAIRDSVVAEAGFGLEAIRQTLAKKEIEDVFDANDEGKADSQSKRWQRDLDATSPAGRQRLLGVIQTRAAARTHAMERILAGPERTWAERFETLDETNEEKPQDLADALLGQTAPVFSGSASTAARIRTQLRLLSLHAQLIQYRWDYGRYPKSLDATDPLTREPYLYEVREDGTIRLASKGTPQTGEIELKYARPTKNDREVAP